MSGIVSDYAGDIDFMRQRMIEHPVFTAIQDIQDLRIFMEAHVFAVWDFMSLVKRLQRDLTCIEVPWLPPRDRHAAQLINQIVLGEETDVDPSGEPVSHLELYLGAMREVGADTARFERFQTALANGATLAEAFDHAAVAPFIREFTGHTLQIASGAPLLTVMASFFYGREDVIPRMFSTLLEKWRIGAEQAPLFVYYLKRHIEVDSDQHGPAAKAILAAATADDPLRGLQVLDAAGQSIEARIRLWDGLLTSLNSWKQGAAAAAARSSRTLSAASTNLYHRDDRLDLRMSS
jgi:pyrroloquinoline quinone (PQQ) biosynthesis protein C